MGRKKRTTAPHSKPSKLSPPPAPAEVKATEVPDAKVDGGASNLEHSAELSTKKPAKSEATDTESKNNAVDSAIKVECEKAMTALRRGNHSKALRLMKDLCSKHEKSPYSAFIHRAQGTVCVKVASIINDANAKQRHLKNAIESARTAVSLSPSSIEFAHFYANLLYDSATEAKEYDEVVHVCERALGIVNPVDPYKESLQDEKEEKISTADVQNELRALIQKSNIASVSSWMKNLGNKDDKFRLSPIKGAPDDPMESARSPSEIKKATKTPEERRKEIEVRVAAARLLQQKSDSPHLGNDGDNTNRNSKDSGLRVGERRKSGNVKKSVSSDEKRDRVKPYWNSMSSDEKKNLLTIKVLDLRAHFSSSNNRSLCEVLNEALSFGEVNKEWTFWTCCRCDKNFADADSFMQHVVQEHMGSLLPKMQLILPDNVENEWAEMLLNHSWKPLDLNGAIRMLEKQSKSDTPDLLDGIVQDNRDFENLEWIDFDAEQTTKETLLNVNWPLTDDPERAKLLESIHAILRVLVIHNCLASSHLSKVIFFAVEELQCVFSCDSQLNSCLDRTPMCICFLGAPELQKILNFLQEISQSCGLNRYSEKSNIEDDSKSDDIMENIILSQDGSVLVLDEHSLPCNAAANDVPSASHVSYENGVILDSDALLSWIYTGAPTSEQLPSWKRIKAEKNEEGQEILQLLEKESYHLQGLCERKCERLSYEEALQAVEDLCLEEGKKREHVEGFLSQSYDNVLKKRKEELLEETDCKVLAVRNKFESDAITKVLKDAESLNINQVGFEETSSHPSDLESGEEDDSTKEYLHQVDSCIEAAIQKQKEQVSTEISKIDARIMKIVSGMQQLEVRLQPAASHDVRSILIPLVKSFVRACLEGLAEKDATKKSDAAREAFLAELARDAKKGGAGVDSLKHVHERSKDRKKNRKTKNPKATNIDELQDLTPTEILLPNAREEEGLGSEIAVPLPDDALQVEKEEYQRRIELEAEEKKLEETLEYQRRIENEAKLKHLAEQNKTDTIELMIGDLEIHVNEQGAAMKDPMMHKDGLASSLEVVPHNTAIEAAPRTGLPNEDIPQDDGSFTEQRSGRRGRRRKGRKYLASKPDIDYSDLDQPRSAKNSHVDGGDKGHKTPSERQAEEGDGERFQPDLEKTVCQSIDKGDKTPSERQAEEGDEERFQADLQKALRQSIDGEDGRDTYGAGLKNEWGEYNCFLNVIIQSLWHIRRFRGEFLGKPSSEHAHVGEPCVICALYDIFNALSMAATNNRREAVSPTSLRVALSNLYPDSNFFQEGQMNDASEVLGEIFNCLHRSFTPATVATCPCIVHSIFGMDIIERMNCHNCGLESRFLDYPSFFHNINASALRTMKVLYPEKSFDELLNLVIMNDELACDPEAGGCGKLNYIPHILKTPTPHVFTTVLGWQNTSESAEDINATLAALSTEIDISVLYRGLDSKYIYHLVSVVCYYGLHYFCFAYSHDHEKWILYNDQNVKVIGVWDDVLKKCERGHLQLQVLVFEAAN